MFLMSRYYWQSVWPAGIGLLILASWAFNRCDDDDDDDDEAHLAIPFEGATTSAPRLDDPLKYSATRRLQDGVTKLTKKVETRKGGDGAPR